jgi:hypothetical protein
VGLVTTAHRQGLGKAASDLEAAAGRCVLLLLFTHTGSSLGAMRTIAREFGALAARHRHRHRHRCCCYCCSCCCLWCFCSHECTVSFHLLVAAAVAGRKGLPSVVLAPCKRMFCRHAFKSELVALFQAVSFTLRDTNNGRSFQSFRVS